MAAIYIGIEENADESASIVDEPATSEPEEGGKLREKDKKNLMEGCSERVPMFVEHKSR